MSVDNVAFFIINPQVGRDTFEKASKYINQSGYDLPFVNDIESLTYKNFYVSALKACFNKKFPRWKNKKVNFIRYADDFVITAISKEVISKECKQITTFMSSKISNNSRVTLHRDSLKSA